MGAAFNAGAILVLLGATASALAAQRLHSLRSFLEYGKLRRAKRKPQTLLEKLGEVTVNHGMFCHFYIWLDILVILKLLIYQSPTIRDVFLLIQGTRRAYEQIWLFHTSPTSTMHLSHYLIGLVFYTIQALCDVTECCDSIYFATTIFAVASTFQALCHRTLANTKKYLFPKFPFTSWSSNLYTACPHYGAEILIYSGLLLLSDCRSIFNHDHGLSSGFLTCLVSVVWVTTCLAISGNETRLYYEKQAALGNHRHSQSLWAIFPFIY